MFTDPYGLFGFLAPGLSLSLSNSNPSDLHSPKKSSASWSRLLAPSFCVGAASCTLSLDAQSARILPCALLCAPSLWEWRIRAPSGTREVRNG